MIYLDFSKKLQVIHIPKNGDYTGKIENKPTFDEGYDKGYQDGLEDCECGECPECNEGSKYHTVKTDVETLYASVDGLDGYNMVEINASEYGNKKYEEGYNQGKSECGEGGECNLDDLNVEWEANWNSNVWYAELNGFDGYRAVSINAERALQEKYEEGYEQGKSEGGEGGSCNIQETKWVHPSINDIDSNGYLVYYKDDGYDGMDRIALQMDNYNQEKYNEGYEQGKSECGEGGECNLGDLNVEWQAGWDSDNFYAEREGLDGYRAVHINVENALLQKYEEGKNEVVKNLKPITITSNGTYTPPKSYYMNMDSDDCFPLGTFGNRIAFELKIDIREKSNERRYILGNWINDTFQGIWCDNNIGFDWGKYYGAYGAMPIGITTLKWWSDDDGNYRFNINDGGYSMATDGVDFSSIDLLLGALNNTCANMNFYSLKIWNDSSSYLNENEPDYVYSVGEAENAIYKNNEVVSNIGDGAYAFKVEYQGNFGFNEVNVSITATDFSSEQVENKYSHLAFITRNFNDTDTVVDKTKLLTRFGVYIENGSINFTQYKNGICLAMDSVVERIEEGAIDWNNVDIFRSYRITEFGENMTRDKGSNLSELYIQASTFRDEIVKFEDGCFATSNRLNKIVFVEPVKVIVKGNPFEGISSQGKLIVKGIEANRSKYTDLINLLPADWEVIFNPYYSE